jgi:predicted ribosomally synthesized peptide with SipW-like signal peptide
MRHTRSTMAGGMRAAMLVALALALLVSGGVGHTLAVLTASKATTAAFTTGTLGKSTVTLAKGTGNTVVVTWTAAATGAKYGVTRDGGTPMGNCPTVAAPTAVLTCTDTWLSNGTHSYSVTASYQNWTSVSTTVSIAVTAPSLTFASSLAADGNLAVVVTGASWTPRKLVTMQYAFGSQTKMDLNPFNLNPTSSATGGFTVNWEDNCIDGDGLQRRADVPAWVWATDGTYSVIGTGTMVCSKYTR